MQIQIRAKNKVNVHLQCKNIKQHCKHWSNGRKSLMATHTLTDMMQMRLKLCRVERPPVPGLSGWETARLSHCSLLFMLSRRFPLTQTISITFWPLPAAVMHEPSPTLQALERASPWGTHHHPQGIQQPQPPKGANHSNMRHGNYFHMLTFKLFPSFLPWFTVFLPCCSSFSLSTHLLYVWSNLVEFLSQQLKPNQLSNSILTQTGKEKEISCTVDR